MHFRRKLGLAFCIGVSQSMFVGVTASAQDGNFSSWIGVSGQSHIEYRWRSNGDPKYSSCDVEVRNLNKDDRAYYTGSFDYVDTYQKDQTQPIIAVDFPYPNAVVREFAQHCSKVTGLVLAERK